jgi:osmotically-inducible protein OsmY
LPDRAETSDTVEHDRAMALARETDGVTEVIDDLKMLQRVG